MPVANRGTVSLVGSSPGTDLRVTGAYVGNGGTLRLGTMLHAVGPGRRRRANRAAFTTSTTSLIERGSTGEG